MVSEKIAVDFFNSISLLNLNRYYIIIAIMVLSSASLFVFIPPATFAESSLNSSLLTMINSTEIEILFNKASVLHNEQRYDMSMQYYDKVLAIDPSDVDALNGKAVVLSNLQRYDEAIEYYDKVLAIDPSDVIALNNKGSVLSNLQRYDEAIE